MNMIIIPLDKSHSKLAEGNVTVLSNNSNKNTTGSNDEHPIERYNHF